jgi:hypothetical protein
VPTTLQGFHNLTEKVTLSAKMKFCVVITYIGPSCFSGGYEANAGDRKLAIRFVSFKARAPDS